jgi:hypothetical protein
MKSKRFLVTIAFLLLVAAALACSSLAPTAEPDATATAQALGLRETEAALETTSTALAGLLTETAATATPPPTATTIPTATPIPTATVTPGPLTVTDDFSSESGIWEHCQVCKLRDGALYMGPYPSSNKLKGYIALCIPCGQVREYTMSVDTWFVEGASDRGFGFVLREWEGSYLDLEVFSWQVFGVWFYDAKKGNTGNAWGNLLPGGYVRSPAIRAGRLVNHLEVKVEALDQKTDNFIISINQQAVKSFELPAGAGRVGLGVALHSLGVAFDNFFFQGVPLRNNSADQPNG